MILSKSRINVLAIQTLLTLINMVYHRANNKSLTSQIDLYRKEIEIIIYKVETNENTDSKRNLMMIKTNKVFNKSINNLK